MSCPKSRKSKQQELLKKEAGRQRQNSSLKLREQPLMFCLITRSSLPRNHQLAEMLQQIQESFWRSGEVRQSDFMWCWRKWGKWDAEPSELQGDGPNSVIKNMYESYLIKKVPTDRPLLADCEIKPIILPGSPWYKNVPRAACPEVLSCTQGWLPLVQKCT